jgi:predicted GH43/DUF377 family glycosyl hydrolase
MLTTIMNVVDRYEKNPVVGPADFPVACSGVYNCGVAAHNGRYYMACRVETPDIRCYVWIADSDDGVRFTPRPAPVSMPESAEFEEFTSGMYYDPRLTFIGDTAYIMMAAHSGHGCRLALLRSDDIDSREFEFVDFVSEVDNRNGVLFPAKVGGNYVRYDRPNTAGDQGNMWLSYSPDLIHWGRHRFVLGTFDGWAWKKVGPGAPPVATVHGWLVVFHGVHVMGGGQYNYYAGVMLTDLNEPHRIVAKARCPILSPGESYERVGHIMNTVFPTALIVEENGDAKLYYGAADRVQCLALTTVDRLIEACYER